MSDFNYNQSTLQSQPLTNSTRSGFRRQILSDDEARYVERIFVRIRNSDYSVNFSPFFNGGKCLVCWKHVADNLIVPCNHLVLCGHCVNFSNRCVLCYQGVNNVFSFADPQN